MEDILEEKDIKREKVISAGVTQWFRVSDFQSECREFDSHLLLI